MKTLMLSDGLISAFSSSLVSRNSPSFAWAKPRLLCASSLATAEPENCMAEMGDVISLFVLAFASVGVRVSAASIAVVVIFLGL